MNTLSALTGERSDSKVAAVFERESTARAVASRLRERLGRQASQVQVVTPDDSHPGRKLEPEGHGIFRTIIVAHYKLGLAGLAVGAMVYAAMYVIGLDGVTQSPWLAAALVIGYGGVFGLMAGGLVSLRPDHDPYIGKVQGALEAGRYAVVVHAFDSGQRDRAVEELAGQGGEPVRTL